MSEIEPIKPRNGLEVTAQDIVGTMVSSMKERGVPVTSRARAIIGKQAKELLADGFEPETVYAASVIALRRGEPHVVHYIAQDMVLARAGQRVTRAEYNRELQNATAALRPVSAAKRAMMEGSDGKK